MSTFIKEELELTIKQSLEQITDQFHLDEVGSPYKELHAVSASAPGRVAPRLGEVRVWHPRAGTKDNPVEKLVLLKISVKQLTSQWLFCFSSGNSLAPHFSLGLSTGGRGEATCGLHIDLISKVQAVCLCLLALPLVLPPPLRPAAQPAACATHRPPS